MRDALRWGTGTRLKVRDTPDGLLLTAAAPEKTRDARSVAGCTGYRGPVVSIEAMNDAIRQGMAARTVERRTQRTAKHATEHAAKPAVKPKPAAKPDARR